jgi:hypothetical protein
MNGATLVIDRDDNRRAADRLATVIYEIFINREPLSVWEILPKIALTQHDSGRPQFI